MGTEQIDFEVDVAQIDKTYGVTLLVSNPLLIEEDENGEVPYYFLVFQGPEQDADHESVSKNFMSCFQGAMTSVGFNERVEEDRFEAMLEDSVELAGELMVRHGFKVLDVKDIDEDLLQALFEGTLPEEDLSLLN